MPQENQSSVQSFDSKNKSASKLLWVIIVVLVLIVIGVILMWRPWQPSINPSDRTISVTGEATVTAAPDQFIFSPTYDSTNADKQTALNGVSTKSSELVTGLKKLGVSESDIKTNADGYSNYSYLPIQIKNGDYTYNLSLTVTAHDAKLAQKVQDYLVTTGPSGAVSPQSDFSDAKKHSLQDTARNKAEKNARSKADQSAANLGFKVKAVKSVTDGTLNSGSILPLGIASGANDVAGSATPQLKVQPGQNTLDYSVSVTYYIH